MKNKLELHLSAMAAARDSLTKQTAHEVHTFILERFNSEKGMPLDFDDWRTEFSRERELLFKLAKEPTNSAASVAANKK